MDEYCLEKISTLDDFRFSSSKFNKRTAFFSELSFTAGGIVSTTNTFRTFLLADIRIIVMA